MEIKKNQIIKKKKKMLFLFNNELLAHFICNLIGHPFFSLVTIPSNHISLSSSIENDEPFQRTIKIFHNFVLFRIPSKLANG